MRYKNLFQSLGVFLTLFVTCASAQSTVAKAHVIYDNNSLYYADNESNLKYKALSLGSDGMFTINFTPERLDGGKAEIRRLRFGLNCTEGKSNCETFLNPEETNQPFLSELFPDYTTGDSLVHEVWIVINEDGSLRVENSMPADVYIPVPEQKTIRFLPSWSNTSAIMYLNGSDEYMVPIKETYCGWFEATINVIPKNAYVYFKQTIGDTYIGSEGISKNPISIENEIKLDSILQATDTVWVSAKYGYPEMSAEFPGELGDCPIKKLPVMMFDWLHGSGSDSENKEAQAGTTSQDFGTGGCAQLTKGMVEDTLGSNGVPVRSANFPENCKTTEHLDKWFLPEVVKTVGGKKYTNVTCRDLELTMDNKGFWLGQRNVDSPEKGLFLLDDFKYLDDAQTIPNPYFDWIDSKSEIGVHNYGFTMKIQAQFEYVKGQYFEFYGDDDVWVFINNKLVVDIGGQHHQSSGSVNLDKLGLTEGETYPFHIFYAERHKVESNFKMRTSIDLQTDASMFFMDLVKNNPNLIQKEVWQKVRERELACDFSSSPETERDELGPSNFVLFGKGVSKGGVALKTLDSAYYAGITISEGYTRVTIDRETLSNAMLLPPGTYYIRVTLQSNPDEYKDIPFTVDPHALPNLAFGKYVKDSSYINIGYNIEDTLYFDQYWTPFGDETSRNITSDTLPINLDKTEKMWAGRSYPIYVMYAEDWATMYSGIPVTITTSTPMLVACDSMGNPVTEILLQQGRASFFVKGIDEVINGTLTLSSPGAENKTIEWTNINMAVPPVPQIETAYIYDRTGDGRADSIWISFKKPLGGQSVLDSAKFTFGNTFNEPYKAKYVDGEMTATIATEEDGFGPGIFTGGDTKPYHGKITVFYTYTDDEGKVTYFPVEGELTDRVGPIILAGEVEYLKDGNTQLKLTFSEGVDDIEASTEMFRFHCWRNGLQDSIVKQASDIGTVPANQWKLIFPKGADTDLVPAVGDSVRFTPPSQDGRAKDLLEAFAHENNPWVRITGEQRVTVTSPGVVALSPDSPAFEAAKEIIKSDSATVPKLLTGDNVSAEAAAAQFGTQGHFLGDLDMAQLVENEIAEIVKVVQANSSYVDKDAVKKDSTAINKTFTIEQIIDQVAKGEISIDKAKKKYGLDDKIVDAYKNGLLTKDNLQYYSRGTEADIEKIVAAVADKTELRYKATYFTSLGQFVNEQGGVITCNDDIYKQDGAKNCLGNDGKLFLAWNMRSEDGRLAATGVYIARIQIKIKVNSKVITDRTQDFLWGVRRGNVNAVDLGL